MIILPVRPIDDFALRELPLVHRDPFDRHLIAQAIVERMPIMTVDPQFSRYTVDVIR